jgi:hypothetical protein
MTSAALSPKPVIAPKVAIAGFLQDMEKVAKRTFPAWEKTLVTGLEECPLSYDQRRAVLEVHPLDDYYLAGVIALEAANIRMLFAPDEASELLSTLAEQVDTLAGRNDRAVSDLVFFIVNRIELVRGIDKQKMPYDQVVKAILQRLGVDKMEATHHLMTETIYRHNLGEPLALGVPYWWRNFQAKYKLPGDIDAGTDEIKVTTLSPKAAQGPAPAARKPRRAVAFV